jgi:addiction module RelE/StbE family toxin
MWRIEEHRRIDRQLAMVPAEILRRYEKWQDIAAHSGPAGLKLITGFRDEALSGQWRGYRSSRLNLKYRVIYQVFESRLLIRVESVTAHDYRRFGT